MSLPRGNSLLDVFRGVAHSYACKHVPHSSGLAYPPLLHARSFQSMGDAKKISKRVLWELLFGDFSKFEDCRATKSLYGGNGPDFIHKEDKEGLWISGRFPAPVDIMSRIKALPATLPEKGSLMEAQVCKSSLQSPNQTPQLKAVHNLKPQTNYNSSQPRQDGQNDTRLIADPTLSAETVAALAPASSQCKFFRHMYEPYSEGISHHNKSTPFRSGTFALWEKLFTDISQFEDFRDYKAKQGGNAPDFKHKETGIGLWLTGRFPLPREITSRFADLPAPAVFLPANDRALWEELFSDPSQFDDMRARKSKSKGPQFRHKTSGKGLWLTGQYPLPEDVKTRAAALEVAYKGPSAGSETRALWGLLSTDISQFKDLRTQKAARAGSGPDFVHRETKKGLWMTGPYPTPLYAQQIIRSLPPPTR